MQLFIQREEILPQIYKGSRNRNMSTEKTPVLHLNKMPKDCESQKEKCCSNSKSAVTWIFLVILLSLFVVVSIQFFYTPFEHRISFWEEHPMEVKRPHSRHEDFIYNKKHEVVASNPWDFEFLIDPPDLCATHNPPSSAQYASDPEVKFLMLVPSAVDHLEQRRAIRNTWGSVAEKPFGPMRLGFVLGTTFNRTVHSLILEESSQFRDIIQADFVDNYRQRTTKGILMLKWVAKRCPHAQYFLKADDDTFVNLENIARILSNEPYISKDRFITGYIQKGAQQGTEAFYQSDEDYLADVYPPYASGSAYVMTIPTAIDLFEASKEVEPLLPEEDVFLTGLCAKRIQVPLIHESSFVIEDPPSPPSWKAFRPLSTAHSVAPDILEQVWNEMTKSVLDSLYNTEVAINSTLLLRLRRNA